MLVTDRKLAGGDHALIGAVEEAIAGGVNALQLREPDLVTAELLLLAVQVRDAIAGRAVFLVNSSLEVALAAGADGVHLPEAAPMAERPGQLFLIGRSVHSVEAAKQAWTECSDYLIAGPVYETASHVGMPPSGPKLIESITGAVPLPVLAVGGITGGRVEEVMRAGASGVAVISAVLGSSSPRSAARELRDAVDLAWAMVESIEL